jgi:hypothetical protein
MAVLLKESGGVKIARAYRHYKIGAAAREAKFAKKYRATKDFTARRQ